MATESTSDQLFMYSRKRESTISAILILVSLSFLLILLAIFSRAQFDSLFNSVSLMTVGAMLLISCFFGALIGQKPEYYKNIRIAKDVVSGPADNVFDHHCINSISISDIDWSRSLVLDSFKYKIFWYFGYEIFSTEGVVILVSRFGFSKKQVLEIKKALLDKSPKV